MFEYIRPLEIGEEICMNLNEKERYSIKITEKRRVFYDKLNNYTMIEIFDHEKINNFIVFNDNFNYANTLYNEVICLYIKTGKINRNTIMGYKRNNNDNIFIEKVYNPRIILKSKETNKELIFLNDKNNEYPLIDSTFLDFHLIFMDLRKILYFKKNILPTMPKIKKFKYKAIKRASEKSYGFFKDGRLTLYSFQHFDIFDTKFEEEINISFDNLNARFNYHYVLKNDDILILPDGIIIRIDSQNNYSIIQKLPYISYYRRKVCECKDLLLLFGDAPFIEIFKYDKIKEEYIFENNYPIGNKIKDAFKIKTDQFVIIHGFNIDFFKVYDNKLSLIAKCKLEEPGGYDFDFYHFLYKNRYLLCDNLYSGTLLFDIRLKKFVCKLSSCEVSLSHLLLLSNGNLLNYSLTEFCIFDKKVFKIQQFNPKINNGINSIICQMSDGTIIINENY